MDLRTPTLQRHNSRSTPQSGRYIKSQWHPLSETCTSSSFNNNMATPRLSHITGPLLASTPINYNLSTYVDSKSPGLSERVIQYSNENQECRATHQPKYGAAGVFPVVHLFKKNLPVRTISPSKVTTHVTLRESGTHSNVERSTLSDDTTLHADVRSHHDIRGISANTHSVLDALKEISRKRIHSGDQCLQSNNYKRHRKDYYVDTSENKNLLERIPSTHSAGKVQLQMVSEVPCIVNDIAASLTSVPVVEPKRSTRAVSTEMEEQLLVHAETQTDEIRNNTDESKVPKQAELESKISEEDNSVPIENERDNFVQDAHSTIQNSAREPAILNSLFFADATSEAVKRNKVATLLSALTGTDPSAVLKKDKEKENATVVDFSHQIKSILSHHDKPKHEKHVTFNIPEKETSSCIETPLDDSDKDKPDSVLEPTVIDQIPYQYSEKKTENLELNENQPSKGNEFSLNTTNSISNTSKKISSIWPSATSKNEDHKTDTGAPVFVAPPTARLPIQVPSKQGGFKFEFTTEKPFPFSSTAIDNNAMCQVSTTESTVTTSTTSILFVPSTSASFTNFASRDVNTNFNFNNGLPTVSGIRTTCMDKPSVQFGRNTTVTSTFGMSTISSTGFGANSTMPGSPPGFFKNITPSNLIVPGFKTSQSRAPNATSVLQESGFKFNLTKSSPTTSVFNSTSTPSGFGPLNANFTVSSPSTTSVAAVSSSNNMFSFIGNTATVSNSTSGFVSSGAGNATVFTPAVSNNQSNSFGQASIFGKVPEQKSIFAASANNQSNTGTFGNNLKSNSFEVNKESFGSNAFTTNVPPAGNGTFTSVFTFGSPSSATTSTPFFGSVTASSGTANAVGNLSSASFNPPGFGSSTFTPKFIAPTAGIFNIGSGLSNSNPKSRTQLKARRRT